MSNRILGYVTSIYSILVSGFIIWVFFPAWPVAPFPISVVLLFCLVLNVLSIVICIKLIKKAANESILIFALLIVWILAFIIVIIVIFVYLEVFESLPLLIIFIIPTVSGIIYMVNNTQNKKEE